MRRLLAVVLAIASFGVSVVPAPATARATGCVFDPMTATLRVTGTTLRRDGDAITLNGQPCAAATVTNTDTISVVGSIEIDLGGGPFAPGATSEEDGEPEIEFVLMGDGISIGIDGSTGADRIKPATHEGQGEINLNAGEMPKDPDVTFPQSAVEQLLIDGRGGNDSVIAHGHGVRPYLGVLLFFAGSGNDRFVPGTPGAEGSAFVGDRGHDAFDISWLPSSGSFIDLRQQGAAYGPSGWFSSVSQVEDVVGHTGPDGIYGTESADRIEGGGGRDVLVGRGGDDHISSEGRATIDAGPGDDECVVFPEVRSIKRCEKVVYAVV